jgi:hypothetical protein
VRFALRSTAPGADGSRGVGLANYSALAEAYGQRRTRPGTHPAGLGDRLAVGDATADRRSRADLDNVDGYTDPYGYAFGRGGRSWYIRGATPDRRPFVVQTLTLDDRRPRVFLIMEREPRFPGFADPRGPMPVQVRLPGAQGIVIACQGAELCYRVKAGAWLPVGPDAALVPAAATRARATRPGGRSTTVDLH